MAIVKFISDKECQIFIDKEYVGEVTNDYILKQTLEPGGYLIEVKDEDANLLKKYNLEIKATDNQVLQDVSDGDSSLDGVIDQLKNDPSLEFHCNRASFCYNGLYGYVNKRFEVVIPAIYTVANNFKDDKAFVVREFPEGKKTTLIDEEGNMFFNRWFDYIGESEETILLGIENRIIVYSKIKYDKTAEYFNGGYDFRHQYVPVYKKEGIDELYGFIDFDGKEVAPLLFDKVWNFDDNGNAKVFFWGFYDTLDNKNFRLHDHLLYKEDKEIKTFKDLLYYYLFPFNKYGYTTSNCLCYDIEIEISNKKWIIVLYEYCLTNQSGGKETKIECDKILYVGNGCIAYRNGLTSIVKFLESNEEFSFSYNYILPVNKVSGGYISSCYYAPDKFLIRKNGKYGLINTQGEEELPVIYDSFYVIYPEYNANTNPIVFAIIQQSNTYAIANISKGNILVPFEYESIICMPYKSYYSGKIFLLHKNGKYFLYSGSTEEVVSEAFDDFIIGDTHIVRIGNKYGIVNSLGNYVLAVENDYIHHVGSNSYLAENKEQHKYAFGNFKSEEVRYFNLDSKISILYSDENDDIFLIELNGKYGCMNCYGELLEHIIYDNVEVVSKESISPATYIIRTCKDGTVNNHKVTLYSWQRKNQKQ